MLIAWCTYIIDHFYNFMLVLMKYFGCRSMSLVRYFSDTTEAIKMKRKTIRNANYSVPTLSEHRKQVKFSTLIVLGLM